MGKRSTLTTPPFRAVTALWASAQASEADRLRVVLGWLNDRQPVRRWRLGDRARLVRTLQIFALQPGPGWQPETRIPAALPSPRVLEAMHRALQRGVAALLDGRPWAVPGHVTGTMTPTGVELAADFPARALHAVAQQLLAHRAHIRHCARPRCGRLFYGRKRAVYCSVACGQQVRDARKRGGGR